MKQTAPTPKTKSLYEIWQEHRDNGTCGEEFLDWNDFRDWYIKSKAKLDDIANLNALSKEAYGRLIGKASKPTKTDGDEKTDAKTSPESDAKKPVADLKKDGE